MEILVVALVALIVFGPEKLPEIARTLGKATSELRRMADDVKTEFESGFDADGEFESGVDTDGEFDGTFDEGDDDRGDEYSREPPALESFPDEIELTSDESSPPVVATKTNRSLEAIPDEVEIEGSDDDRASHDGHREPDG
jgi:Tat protein translocase TatB subunit